ncbi:MAG TPA: hypothetical protein DCM62_04695 [Bacteroidales bacterium]|nr:hypothetical protein [Bacteroidales bacterium]
MTEVNIRKFSHCPTRFSIFYASLSLIAATTRSTKQVVAYNYNRKGRKALCKVRLLFFFAFLAIFTLRTLR